MTFTSARKLYVNVVMSSGTAMFREIVERMTNELTALALFTMKIRGGCSDLVWIGRPILSSLRKKNETDDKTVCSARKDALSTVKITVTEVGF